MGCFYRSAHLYNFCTCFIRYVEEKQQHTAAPAADWRRFLFRKWAYGAHSALPTQKGQVLQKWMQALPLS